MRLSDMISFGPVDRGMFGGIVADIPPRKEAADHGAEASHNERQPPRAEFSDEAGDDQRAERRAERRAAVEQGRAARPFRGGHPNRIEFATGWVDRRFRGAEAEPRQNQYPRVGRNGGDGLKESPSQSRGGDDDARLKPIGEHAARDLHQRVGEKERAENESLRPEVEIELLGDHRHRDRDGCAIDVVDRRSASA